MKPGAGRIPKILREPPTESEGREPRRLVGSAGYARYSARVLLAPAKRSGAARPRQAGWHRESSQGRGSRPCGGVVAPPAGVGVFV